MLFEDFQDGRYGCYLGLERHNFSNSESLCRSDASHEVLAQSNTVWEEMSFEEFQDGRRGSHLGYRNWKQLAILNFHVSPMPPIKFQLSPTYEFRRDVV